jgi:hypothetical protein
MTNERQSPKGQPNQPTGTSGRRSGSDKIENGDAKSGESTGTSRRVNRDDEEDSPLGNRTTYR